MARTMAGLPDGTRASDHKSLGVVTKAFPLPLIRRILAETDRTSLRERDLPAPVMVYVRARCHGACHRGEHPGAGLQAPCATNPGGTVSENLTIRPLRLHVSQPEL